MNKRERVLQPVNPQETDFVPYNFHAVSAVRERLCHHYWLRVTTRRCPTLAATSCWAAARYEPETPSRDFCGGI